MSQRLTHKDYPSVKMDRAQSSTTSTLSFSNHSDRVDATARRHGECLPKTEGKYAPAR